MNEMGAAFHNRYVVECRRPDGSLRWCEDITNVVMTAGRDDVLSQYFKGSNYSAAWYVGLVAATPTFDAADTMASHAGWTEKTDYDEGARPTLTLGTASNASINNNSSKAIFTVSAGTHTFGGLFLVSNSTKGGSTGVLYSGAAFSGGDQTAEGGDTISMSVTLSLASA